MNRPIAIGIVLHASRVLVGLRAREPWKGCAEFPGGKLLPGETVEAAVKREVLEECGVAVRVKRLHDRTRADGGRGVPELHFFLCRLADGKDAERVRTPFRWIPIGELDSLRFPPGNAEALRRLQRSAAELVGGADRGRSNVADPPAESPAPHESRAGSIRRRSS